MSVSGLDDPGSLATDATLRKRPSPNLVRWVELAAAVIPAAVFAVVMFVFAIFAALGVFLALLEHLRRGEPYWQSDLTIAAYLIGPSTGGVIGVLGLTIAVCTDARALARRPAQWRAVIIAMVVGLTTAVGVLVSGLWPRTDLIMSYPLIAASTVAAYRLPLLIVARARAEKHSA